MPKGYEAAAKTSEDFVFSGLNANLTVMADLKTHCEDCLKELGDSFRHVHEWLDELFRYVGPDHRGYRHNRKGVEEVRRRWGDKAAKAAEIHLKRDGEGWITDEEKE